MELKVINVKGEAQKPVDASETRGTTFYDLFIDRSHWPRLMRQGYAEATKALDGFRDAEASAVGESPGRAARA